MNVQPVVVVALLVVLAGCASGPPAGAIPALCDARCFAPCVGERGDTGVRWASAADDPAAFDALGESVIPALAEKLRDCELRRRACDQCLRRLRQRGVIEIQGEHHD